MSCDLCGKTGVELVYLRTSYQTESIKQICTSCEKEVDNHLDKIKSLSFNWVARVLKIWMRRRRMRK